MLRHFRLTVSRLGATCSVALLVVALLVAQVDIGTEGLAVRLRLDGLGGLAREMLAGEIREAA